MKKNVGSIDKIIRLILAVILAYVAYSTTFEAAWLNYVLYAIAAVMVITSFVSFCPLYCAVNVNTCKIKE
jgi:hypothetical protein